MQERHLERIEWAPRPGIDTSVWPFTLPPVAALIRAGGLEVPPGVTFVVGENGSGKSTLVEAMAAVYPRSGFAPSHGNVVGATPSAEDSPLRWHLRAVTHPLGLVSVLADLAEAGCQVIAATHSPILTALPGASLLELGDHGLRETRWDELQLVADHRAYLDDPRRFLRHLL